MTKVKKVSWYVTDHPSVNYLLDLLPLPPPYPSSIAIVITDLTGASGSAMYQRWLKSTLHEGEIDQIDEHEDKMLQVWLEEVNLRADTFNKARRAARRTNDTEKSEQIFFAQFPQLQDVGAE